MTELRLTAEVRPAAEQGKRRARRLRRQGFVPAILYGKAVPNGSIPIKVALHDLQKLAQDGHLVPNASVRLQVRTGADEVAEYTAVVQEVQRHPLQLTWLHVDFFVPASVTEPVGAAAKP